MKRPPWRIRYTVSGFLTDLLGGSAVIALFRSHLEFAAAGALGLVALLIKDHEHNKDRGQPAQPDR